jgi:hypothetical protein
MCNHGQMRAQHVASEEGAHVWVGIVWEALGLELPFAPALRCREA